MKKVLFGLVLFTSCQQEKLTPTQDVRPAQSTSSPSGAFSEESARQLLAKQSDALRACLSEDTRWSLSISLRVEPSGKVSSASVFDLLQGSKAASCAEETLQKISFPSFSGDAVRVNYSYSLRAVIEPIGASSVPVPVVSTQPTSLSIPTEASAALLQAEKLFALGEIEQAQKTLEPFQQKPLPEMLYLLAGIYAKKGQVAEMCSAYQSYLSAAPQSPAAAGVKKQITKLCQ
jgi:hypothetical protein